MVDQGMFTETDCRRLILDAEKDELRVQVSTLMYEVANLKQEREMEAIRYEKETRSLQLKADADFRKAQVRFMPGHVEISGLTCSATGSRIRQSPGDHKDRSVGEGVERNPGAVTQ